MIELPEAVALARHITHELTGKVIAVAERGNSPHKFAFYNREPEAYAQLLAGRRLGGARAHGGLILVALEPGLTLTLGHGGERLSVHADASGIPRKHQLLLSFTDGSHFSVTVSGWGCVGLEDETGLAALLARDAGRVSPLDPAYTVEHFLGLFDQLRDDDPRSVKYFAISEPGVWGLGNGYTHDILWRAGLHPRRRARELSDTARRAFWAAIVETLGAAVAAGGRDTEKDLHGRPGGYRPVLDQRAKGQPCPTCGSLIEAIAFLGGRCYYCPHCQM